MAKGPAWLVMVAIQLATGDDPLASMVWRSATGDSQCACAPQLALDRIHLGDSGAMSAPHTNMVMAC